MNTRGIAVVAVLCVVLLDLPARGQAPSPLPSARSAMACQVRGGTLKFGISRDAVGIDPHISYGVTSSSIQGNVYDNLVDLDPQGRIMPSLAESWTQPEPTTYVFKLRRNVTFSDGTPFTSADIAYTFQRIRDPQNRLTKQRDIDLLVRSARTPDAYTVEVRLNFPSATFLDLLMSRDMYIVSRKWAEAGGDFRKAAVGTGPYRLTGLEPNVRYTLEHNPTAWNPGCLDRIDLFPYQDDRARVNSLKSGQTDFTTVLTAEQEQLVVEDALASTQGNVVLAVISVYRALGGG